ncbi:hypothetical protein JOQ06_028482 [Pogonophryne albipinna]|uniref:G-protein coupled receptors family 1 profile domain-containing protein n=1 Tax=Pogonophryne albipinna TaxID=1090488 RepID=A0AAD6B831_9TELE|nr:hypothetical protein JOQ06_028482 [Pogonophryne albipinna]
MLGNATDTLAQLRGEFDGLKAHAQDLASSWGVHSLFKDRRAWRTKRHFSELCEDQRLQDPGEHFRVAVFYANIDIVVAQLKNRFVGMSEVAQRFSFLLPRELLHATDKDLSESASALSGQYKDDLSVEFPFQILSLRNALRPTIKKIERGTIKDLAQTLLIESSVHFANSFISYTMAVIAVNFILPLSIMLYCYYNVSVTMKRYKASNGLDSINMDWTDQMDVTKMSIVMIVMFLVAWSPYSIVFRRAIIGMVRCQTRQRITINTQVPMTTSQQTLTQ